MLTSLLFSEALAKPDVDVIEQGVVRVVVDLSGRHGMGSGFIINDQGMVVTNHHVVAGGGRFSISIYPSGSNTKLPAQLLLVNQQYDLAILRVPGLNARAARLSSAEIKKADRVWSVGFPGLADQLGTASDASWSEGTVSRIFSGSWSQSGGDFNIIQHTAEINPGNSGGPLFDDCGRVIGVNTRGSGAGRIARDGSGEIIDIMAGTGVFFASHIDTTIELLRAKGIDFTARVTPCISVPEATQGYESRAIAVLLVMLGILSTLLALRKPRERILRTVEQYSRKVVLGVNRTASIRSEPGVPGLVLTGFDTEGKPIKVIIPGKHIGEGRGATVGRHPKITIATIEDRSVSRRQFRFSYADQTHYIEDLNSSNGTRVNGVRLKPFIKTLVNPGDTIIAGNLEFTLGRHQ